MMMLGFAAVVGVAVLSSHVGTRAELAEEQKRESERLAKQREEKKPLATLAFLDCCREHVEVRGDIFGAGGLAFFNGLQGIMLSRHTWLSTMQIQGWICGPLYLVNILCWMAYMPEVRI